jgi:NAD(P)-dependent dehydrogenase (short-subunit alcohol dehydrogenase family)
VAESTDEQWHRLMSVNLHGAFYCARAAVRAMKQTGGGKIVNVGSEAGLVVIPGQAAYNVSKAAVIMLTKSMAVDHATDNIRVNCVCPGTTFTPLVAQALSRADDPEAARRALESSRPLNRLGRVEEIAEAILYLASDVSAYATGSVLSIDGGRTAI